MVVNKPRFSKNPKCVIPVLSHLEMAKITPVTKHLITTCEVILQVLQSVLSSFLVDKTSFPSLTLPKDLSQVPVPSRNKKPNSVGF